MSGSEDLLRYLVLREITLILSRNCAFPNFDLSKKMIQRMFLGVSFYVNFKNFKIDIYFTGIFKIKKKSLRFSQQILQAVRFLWEF